MKQTNNLRTIWSFDAFSFGHLAHFRLVIWHIFVWSFGFTSTTNYTNYTKARNKNHSENRNTINEHPLGTWASSPRKEMFDRFQKLPRITLISRITPSASTTLGTLSSASIHTGFPSPGKRGNRRGLKASSPAMPHKRPSSASTHSVRGHLARVDAHVPVWMLADEIS